MLCAGVFVDGDLVGEEVQVCQIGQGAAPGRAPRTAAGDDGGTTPKRQGEGQQDAPGHLRSGGRVIRFVLDPVQSGHADPGVGHAVEHELLAVDLLDRGGKHHIRHDPVPLLGQSRRSSSGSPVRASTIDGSSAERIIAPAA